MLKVTTAIAAAFALSAQAALAGPVSLSASETGEAEKRSEKSVAATVVDRLKFSLAAIGAQAGHSSGEKDQSYYSSKEQCEQSKTAADEETETAEAKEAGSVGPEPLYFGF